MDFFNVQNGINGFFNVQNGINGFLIQKIKGHFRYFRERCFVRWKFFLTVAIN